jgi:hypothetical protein
VQAAIEILAALGAKQLDKLAPLLDTTLWVLWPNGAVLHHPAEPLIAHLRAAELKPTRIRSGKPRCYTLAELRAVLPRGVAEAIDGVLELRSAFAVTTRLQSPKGSEGRAILAMAAGPGGTLRARNLILPAPDDAWIASKKDPGEDEALRLAEQLVRRVALGHGGKVNALRPHLMDVMWVRDQPMNAEALADLARQGAHRLGSSELVFLGAQTESLDLADRAAPPGAMAQIRKDALRMFGREYPRLSPRFVVVKLGSLDPSTGRVQPARDAGVLVFLIPEDGDQRRARIGALFM